MAKAGETFTPPSLKKEALHCIENLLIRDEISIDKYELLSKVVELLGYDNLLELGDGLQLKLVDCDSNT
jgi:hypothetical protein